MFNVILVALAFALAFYLFFEKDFRNFAGWNVSEEKAVENQNLALTLAGDYELEKLDALSLDPANRAITSIVYEPLVKREFDFSLKPALALSWGQRDNLTWVFKLRPNVKFHDGSSFDADDVLNNFKILQDKPQSDISNLLKNVDSVDRVEPLEIVFKLKEPDPLFLLRISYFLQPAGNNVGTGFLKLASNTKKQADLESFADYWGPDYALAKLTILNVSDPYQKNDMLNTGKIDVLNNISKSSIGSISGSSFDYLQVPKLEIGFLLFNGKSASLRGKTKSFKEILDFTIDRKALLADVDENFSPIYQFVPRGVAGVSSNIALPELDIFEGKKILKDTFNDNATPLVIHYLPGMEYIAESIQSELSALGLGVLVQELPWEDMQVSMKEGKADLYLLMWKFDMPDNSEFLKNFVLNNALYKVASVSNLVNEAIKEEDFFVRSQKLQEIMKQVVDEEPLGFPLFEKNTNYVFKNNLNLRPNLDGSLDMQFIKLKAE